jgi:hypothetical protein
MPGDDRPGQVAATAELVELSTTGGTSSKTGRKEATLTSRTPDTENLLATKVEDQAAAIEELQRRLREQTAQNAQLDAELRYLLQELAIRKEFIAELEQELQSMHATSGEHGELIVEFSAYRGRISHRIVDHLVDSVHRRPWIYRPLRLLSRGLLALASRAHARTANSGAVAGPTDDGGCADPPRPELHEPQ